MNIKILIFSMVFILITSCNKNLYDFSESNIIIKNKLLERRFFILSVIDTMKIKPILTVPTENEFASASLEYKKSIATILKLKSNDSFVFIEFFRDLKNIEDPNHISTVFKKGIVYTFYGDKLDSKRKYTSSIVDYPYTEPYYEKDTIYTCSDDDDFVTRVKKGELFEIYTKEKGGSYLYLKNGLKEKIFIDRHCKSIKSN